MTLQKQLEYVHPEVLVDTQWVEDHLNDPKVRIAEPGSVRKVRGRTKWYQIESFEEQGISIDG